MRHETCDNTRHCHCRHVVTVNTQAFLLFWSTPNKILLQLQILLLPPPPALRLLLTVDELWRRCAVQHPLSRRSTCQHVTSGHGVTQHHAREPATRPQTARRCKTLLRCSAPRRARHSGLTAAPSDERVPRRTILPAHSPLPFLLTHPTRFCLLVN